MTSNKKIVIYLIIISILSSGCIEILTDGKHNGQITAVEKSGIIWKTYDMYIKSDISSSQEENYCVEDILLIQKLENLSKERKKVTVLYRDELIVMPWRCNLERSGIVTGIEE